MSRFPLARWAFAAALALLTVLAPGLGGGSAHAASFGLNIQSLVNWDTIWGPSATAPPWDPYLDAMARDGMDVARMDASWALVQPQPTDSLTNPANWAVADRIATELARRGLRWLPVVVVAPEWARQDLEARPGCAPIHGQERYLPPKDPAQFAAFAAALARRYGAGGTFWAAHPELPALPMTQYEIWNEPNVDLFWNNRPDPAAYVALYNAARTAIKAADPAAEVLVGGIAWGGRVNCVADTVSDDTFLRDIFAAGGPAWPVDGVAAHPYGPATLNVVAVLRRQQRELRRANRADLPVQVTEIGVPVRPAAAPPGSLLSTYPPDETRSGTTALVTDVLAGSTCNVGSVLAYNAVDRETAIVGDDPPGVGAFDLIEHWFGFYAAGATRGTAAPATTASAAFAAAIARQRAAVGAPRTVPVCSPPGETGAVLPLSLQVVPTAVAGCWNAEVRYQGLPITGAEIITSAPITPSGTTIEGPAFTSSTGIVGFCSANPGPTIHAVVGGGRWDPDQIPLVARSPDVVVPPAGVTGTGRNPAPVPAPVATCALGRLQAPAQRLTTVARRGRLTARIRLSTLDARSRCAVTLAVSIPAPRRDGTTRPRRTANLLLGTTRATIATTRTRTIAIRLTRAGKRRLARHSRTVATVRVTLAGAPSGTQVHSTSRRLRR